MRFPEKLTKLLALRGKSQSKLMRETGISQTAISAMTAGKRRPYMDQGLILARALGIPLDYLADDEQDDPPASAELPEDERFILETIRTLGLTKEEAVRALSAAYYATVAPPKVKAADQVSDDTPTTKKRPRNT